MIIMFILGVLVELACAVLVAFLVFGMLVAADNSQKESDKRYKAHTKEKTGDL